MTPEQFKSLKAGDSVQIDEHGTVGVVRLSMDHRNTIECYCGRTLFLDYHDRYTLLPATPPQPEPLRFVQLLGTAEGGLSYALGSDGLIYDHRGDWDQKTQKHYQWWQPVSIPASKEAALEALRAQEGETP